jgi:ABC-2 type transport system ATP-binding protein
VIFIDLLSGIYKLEKIIETDGLTKYYKNGVVGIEDLSISVNPGEIYGFLGSNGAGKTTTIRLLVNLIFPTCGKGKIFGKDMAKYHLDICRDIGYIPSTVRPHKYMTGEEFLQYMGKLSSHHDLEYRDNLLETFNFDKKDLKRKIKYYSSGMARKIALVQTFQHRPRLMIMDEPTEGLDPVMQHIFYKLLKEYRDHGGTVFISSHHLLEVQQVCDRVGIIRQGHLVAVEKIQDLEKKTSRRIYVTFKDKVDPLSLKSGCWEIEAFENNKLTAKLTGSIDTIIKLISRFSIKDISLPDLSLQDVFLEYYQKEDQ